MYEMYCLLVAYHIHIYGEEGKKLKCVKIIHHVDHSETVKRCAGRLREAFGSNM